jgi:hypothetical protein
MWCSRAGLSDEPRKVFAEMDKLSLVDVILPTPAGVSIRKRCISRPTDDWILQQRHRSRPTTFPAWAAASVAADVIPEESNALDS